MVEQQNPVNRKARVGTVVSDRSSQTIVVAVERAARHRLYRKVIRRTKKYHVHDPENAATLGDMVRIEECRPISKTKSWRLVEILTERAVADVTPESIDQTLVSEVQRTAARAAAEEASESDDVEQRLDVDSEAGLEIHSNEDSESDLLANSGQDQIESEALDENGSEQSNGDIESRDN